MRQVKNFDAAGIIILFESAGRSPCRIDAVHCRASTHDPGALHVEMPQLLFLVSGCELNITLACPDILINSVCVPTAGSRHYYWT
ncbi:hypothetical protein DTO166G4_8851 [Paecilomyces variotii]|nr:hypothetical protein DTO166G4_8851 [Paecilomyces variotii]KAJ9234354.1 hypothetical protein DTO166G5_5160 [Paecilomyces variotii]KAJ9407137.1 hypothetical protein DTO045G8_4986 [Paecilomyces variotii]